MDMVLLGALNHNIKKQVSLYKPSRSEYYEPKDIGDPEMGQRRPKLTIAWEKTIPELAAQSQSSPGLRGRWAPSPFIATFSL